MVCDTLGEDDPLEEGDVSWTRQSDQWNISILNASANWWTADSLKCKAKTYSLEGGVVCIFNKKPEDSGELYTQLLFINCSYSFWILLILK